jgi:hypothetical protein
MKTIIALATLALNITSATAEQTVLRDGHGRTVGMAADTGQGTTVLRDPNGRTVGTATTDRSGTTTFRDASGHTVATSSKVKERTK